MSPTSYQAAPPREFIVADAPPFVKFGAGSSDALFLPLARRIEFLLFCKAKQSFSFAILPTQAPNGIV